MTSQAHPSTDEFAERMFGAFLGTVDTLTVYIGDRLGLYSALRERGPLTSSELADAAGVHERYAREWLEQQAVSGILEVEDDSADALERRYGLPDAHAEVLADRDSLDYLSPIARVFVGTANALPQILDAFRSGGGVPWTSFGKDGREGQADQNRSLFLKKLGREWLPSLADVDDRLRRPGARVADIACGAGWSSIAIGLSYPEATVDGYDLDEASIELARANAEEHGVSDRVRFHVHDAGDPRLDATYDLATVFEAIHDMSDPVSALKTMRRLAGDDGAVLVMDEKVADRFEAPGDEVERLMYGFSVLCCLPAGMDDKPSAGTGTVMRTSTLEDYAREAGFGGLDVLDIEHDVFRFYRLRQ
jgi:2-polyprenyl-3-methyl-5-hydroxy-6-metoxy-1,4-benzoquinol methylase